MKRIAVTHEFVDHLPDELQEGKVYVSIPFATAAHKCCCGCANEVVTPLSSTGWSLTFDGETVSLDPSIGNWSLPCQSHYWITRNRVTWARRYSQKEIERDRQRDRRAKQAYFDEKASPSEVKGKQQGVQQRQSPAKRTWKFWRRSSNE